MKGHTDRLPLRRAGTTDRSAAKRAGRTICLRPGRQPDGRQPPGPASDGQQERAGPRALVGRTGTAGSTAGGSAATETGAGHAKPAQTLPARKLRTRRRREHDPESTPGRQGRTTLHPEPALRRGKPAGKSGAAGAGRQRGSGIQLRPTGQEDSETGKGIRAGTRHGEARGPMVRQRNWSARQNA